MTKHTRHRIDHTFVQSEGRRRTAGDHCDFEYSGGEVCGEHEAIHNVESAWELMVRFAEGHLSFEGRVELLANWQRAIVGARVEDGRELLATLNNHSAWRDLPAWMRLAVDDYVHNKLARTVAAKAVEWLAVAATREDFQL